MMCRYKNKENLRNQFSLSQQDLANYLGVSLSLVGMWECNKRTLPHAAHEKVNFLRVEFEKCKASKTMSRSVMQLQEHHAEQHASRARKMMNGVSIHRSRAARLEDRLKVAFEKQEAQLVLLNFIDQQLDSMPENHPDQNQLKWLGVQQTTVKARLLKINKEITRMSFDIDMLRAVAEVHERHWGRF